ncbi:MAG: hypothetical protein WBA33_16525 [Rhodanobacter lindaniclasticus]
MLFPYTYVPHSMEKMQGFIDFIFLDVWCKAPGAGPFGLHLFNANPELQEVVTAFHYSDAQGANFFNGHVQNIHGLFAALSPAQIVQLQAWYHGNNNLEQTCANNPASPLARYADLDALTPELGQQLATFFKGLYSQSLLGLKALRDKIGEIDDHYKTFRRSNRSDRCPFCGLSDLLGPDHGPREAYDHYLPKALYPFNSINFHNLLPTCHHCNSSYKGGKDPAYSHKDIEGPQARRKLFYPFSPQPWHVKVQVSLQPGAHEYLQPDDITLGFGPPELAEQIDTWKDVYGIEERYRAKLCGEDARDWLEQALTQQRWHDESQGTRGRSTSAYLQEIAEYAQVRPWANANFLKHGFLQACAAAGMFQAATRPPTYPSG